MDALQELLLIAAQARGRVGIDFASSTFAHVDYTPPYGGETIAEERPSLHQAASAMIERLS